MTDLPDVARTDRQFEIRMGDAVAFAEYRVMDGAITFPHTVVPDAFSGKGGIDQPGELVPGFGDAVAAHDDIIAN